MNSIDELGKTVKELKYQWEFLRWLAVGPVLIAIGVSQAIYGWAGNALGMRIGYSSACIVVGSTIFVLVMRNFLGYNDVDEEQPESVDPNDTV